LFTHGMFTTTEYLDAFVEHERQQATGDAAPNGVAGNGAIANGAASNDAGPEVAGVNGGVEIAAAKRGSHRPEPPTTTNPPGPVPAPRASPPTAAADFVTLPPQHAPESSPLDERHEQ
jgi:hypothetical protein